MFNAVWGLKKSPRTSSSVLGNSFKWVCYSCLTLSFILDLCRALPLFFWMHWWDIAQELSPSIDVQDCDEKAWGWLIVLSVWRKSLLPRPSGSYHCENENQQIHKHFGRCCLYSSFFSCKRRTVPSTSHGIVKTNAIISVRCFGNPLWEAQTKFNTWIIIIPLIKFGNILG